MKLKFLLLIFSIFITVNVFADEKVNVSVTSEKVVKNIENIIVNIECNSENILGVITNLVYDKTKLKLVSYNGNNGFEITLGNKLLLDTNKRINNEEKIGTLIFKALNEFSSNETVEIKILDTIVTDGVNEFRVNDSTVKISIEKKITDGLLSQISINNEIMKNFDSRIKEYDVLVPNINEIKISALPKYDGVYIEGLGKKQINDNSSFKIVAKKDSIIETYTINLHKEIEGTNTIKGLKELEISGYEIDFSNSIYNYDLNVAYNTKELNINLLPLNSDATIKINGNNLLVGNNVVTVEVFEPNGENTLYYLNVKRNEKKVSYIYIIILVIILVIIILILLILKVVKNKRNSTNNIEDVI